VENPFFSAIVLIHIKNNNDNQTDIRWLFPGTRKIFSLFFQWNRLVLEAEGSCHFETLQERAPVCFLT